MGATMLSGRYEVASRDIVSETFDGDVVVLDLSCGKYFSFTDAGCGLWEALAAGVPPASLVSAEANFSAAGLESFVQKLVDHNLLVVAADSPDVPASDDVLRKLASAKELPDVFVFDDLADLFLADPI